VPSCVHPIFAVEKVSKQQIPFATESIALARKCSLPSVLKRAFYELVRGPDDDLNSSGTILSVNDVTQILRARLWLMKAWQDLALRPEYAVGEVAACTCAAYSRCGSIVIRSPERRREGLEPYFDCLKRYAQDPICGLGQLCDLRWEDEGFCGDWIIERKRSWKKAKEDLWDRLDEMLPSA